MIQLTFAEEHFTIIEHTTSYDKDLTCAPVNLNSKRSLCATFAGGMSAFSTLQAIWPCRKHHYKSHDLSSY
jgi:hypothetical protein